MPVKIESEMGDQGEKPQDDGMGEQLKKMVTNIESGESPEIPKSENELTYEILGRIDRRMEEITDIVGEWRNTTKDAKDNKSKVLSLNQMLFKKHVIADEFKLW